MVGALVPKSKPVLCSACFLDHGLKLDAERYGIRHAFPCPNCGSVGTRKLTPYLAQVLASQFFVRGSVNKTPYGAAPIVQLNHASFGKGDYTGSPWLQKDVALISEKCRIGLFHYGPRLWMIGQVEPLIALCEPSTRTSVVDRIVKEYPERTLNKDVIVYRLRANPAKPGAPTEYDSPPAAFLGKGRLDSPQNPVLYCSQDIEGCVHECRVTVEDQLFLASLQATKNLRLLDLTVLLREENVTEFESLDMAVHMLFFAASHSYNISRAIADAAKQAGFDGLVYPSYFSQVRSGDMPFETAYGISIRRFESSERYATMGTFPNVAIFGRPVSDGRLRVSCINRVVLHKVGYDIRFGPAL